MRKRVLSAVLSMMMIAASVSPAFGAEFSSGDETVTVAEETEDSEQEVIFSEENESGTAEDSVFEKEAEDNIIVFEDSGDLAEETESEPEEEFGSDQEELTEIFQADNDEFVSTDAELLQSAVTMDTAEEITADRLYHGTTAKSEYGSYYVYWYKFTAKEDGTYSLGCRIEDEFYWGDVSIGRKEDYGSDATMSLVLNDSAIEGMTLKKGEVYYIRVYAENDYESGNKFSLMLRSPSWFKQAESITEGKVYGRTDEMFSVNWYKFIPEKDGKYVISASDTEFSVYTGSKADTLVSPDRDEKFYLTGSKIYYIKVDAIDPYSLSVKREMTDRDYIEGILKRQGSLPQLAETEGKKAVTSAALFEEYGKKKTFMQFIPKNTGKYNIKLYQKNDQYQNSFSITIYDSKFELTNDPDLRMCSLEKGHVYYVTNTDPYIDLSNFVFSTEYVPSITSLKILEEPKNKVLYKDCDMHPSALEGWLPGIKLEVAYDNGKKEIISTDNGVKPKTSYGEYLIGCLVEEKTLYDLSAGKYTFTIYSMYDKSKSVKIKNVEVKEKKELPLYTKTGNITVNTTWAGSAYIRFKPQTTGKYVISSSSKGYIKVQKDNLDFIVYGEKSPAEAMLEAGKSYYISSGSGTDAFVWESKSTFTIKSAEKINLSKAKVTVPSSVAYTGKAVTPTVKVTYGTTTLKKGTDYTVSYSKNKDIGEATVTVKGKGSYTDTKKATFNIVLGTPKLGKVTSAAYNKHKITWSKVTGATGYIVYQKINNKWVEIKRTKATSYVNKHSSKYPVLTGITTAYSVQAYRTSGKTTVYSGYSKAGIKGKASLSKPAISKISKTSKGLKLQWKAISGATGYIIQRYDSGKWVTKKTITNSKTLAYTDTTVKKEITYKYRIAAYRTVNKKKVLSTYSAAKKGKVSLSKPAISKISKTSKGLKLQWKAISGATGYVIQRYDSGKWVTKKTITSSKTLTYTDTTAKKGKTYKYRIAAYKTVNKKKVLSTYSAAKAGKR